MDLLNEFEKLNDALKQQRDEIQLQLHLASLEAKQEWEKSEQKWDQFINKLSEISDETKETTDELIHGTKIIGDELKATYTRISERLSK